MDEFPVSVGGVHDRFTVPDAVEVATTWVGEVGFHKSVMDAVAIDNSPSRPAASTAETLNCEEPILRVCMI
jgi:hypothetical protein